MIPSHQMVSNEAALCAKCDTEVHAANKLASKHQRLLLQSLSNRLPTCDICQEKPAFIFCVEDRAMFCEECDKPVHSIGSLAANHQRFLATGIRVALNSKTVLESEKCVLDPPPPNKNAQQISMKTFNQEASSSWAVDDLLQFSDYDLSDKKEDVGFGDLDWFSDIGLFGEHVSQETLAATEVPRLPVYQSSSTTPYKPTKYYMPSKKPRLEIHNDDDEHEFTVPDLG